MIKNKQFTAKIEKIEIIFFKKCIRYLMKFNKFLFITDDCLSVAFKT